MWPISTSCLDSPEACAQAMSELASVLESIASFLRELAERTCLPAPSVISEALNELECADGASRSTGGRSEHDGLEKHAPGNDGVGRRGQELREVRHVPGADRADSQVGLDPRYATAKRAKAQAQRAYARGTKRKSRRRRKRR